jgi:hypothetical protein
LRGLRRSRGIDHGVACDGAWVDRRVVVNSAVGVYSQRHPCFADIIGRAAAMLREIMFTGTQPRVVQAVRLIRERIAVRFRSG